MYEMITNLMIERLEAGVIPWHMPWKTSSGLARNLISKRAYTGFNFIYLNSFGFERPWFLTFNQAKELGGNIRKGAKSYQVIFWKMLDVTKDGETDQIPMLRYYRVFNVDDISGISEDKVPESNAHDHEFDSIGACDELVERWTDCPDIDYNSFRACYIPALDKVEVPNPRTFFVDEHYYATLFHELVHSTGHKKRLGRHDKYPGIFTDKHEYSKEELVAEMGASFLCAHTGIEAAAIDNSVAYIQTWLKQLRSDNKFVLQAASEAQKAVDYILNNQGNVPAGAVEIEKETGSVSFSF